MMDFNERVIPGVSSNFMFKEALARYEFAKKFIKKEGSVLDLGSGTGYGDGFLSKNGLKVLGIDISTEAVNFAKKHFGSTGAKFKKGDITKPVSKDKFDAVCSFEVIEHLKDPGKFLKLAESYLNPEGVFIISTPNSFYSSPGGKPHSEYHVKEYDYAEFKKFLSKYFKNVKIYGQSKSKKADSAWKDFLKSQAARESVASSDKLGIRKLIPKSVKEKIWKYAGNFAGRRTQETLGTEDFPISLKSARLAYYFIAVCRKSR